MAPLGVVDQAREFRNVSVVCYTSPGLFRRSTRRGFGMKIVRSFAFAFLALALPLAAHAAGSTAEQARPAAAAAVRNITIDDYFQIRDVGQPELSPDGQWVAYTVRTKMLKEDKNETRIWMVSTHGGDPLPMTGEGNSSGHPRWSPD